VFVRFIIDQIDSDSGRRQGLFQAAKALRETGRLSGVDERHLRSINDWFDTNLERPVRLAVSPRPHSKAQALSWFKDSARMHIDKMREFAEILRRYDIDVQMIRTDRPGYVLYEDDYQVAAYPFADTQT
jgi:hypothetical protein